MDHQIIHESSLGLDLAPYKILGACKPSSTHRVLTIAPEGVLLPCNVTVHQLEHGTSKVSPEDLLVIMGIITTPGLKEEAEDTCARTWRIASTMKNCE
jgi:uncharacterized protein (DUF302 family)